RVLMCNSYQYRLSRRTWRHRQKLLGITSNCGFVDAFIERDGCELNLSKASMAMNKMVVMAVVGGLALLAGCGSNPRERTTGGAAIGAPGGPIGVGVGALIGGGTGAVTGAVTTPKQVNLGRPVWNNPNAHIGNQSLDVGHQ
ncbi:MAG: hypothetical protein QOJ58_2019, partial [Alphaproteobacteria bacterium]|nr:hypothetical protein [Alphaproteobacteria bacterium]